MKIQPAQNNTPSFQAKFKIDISNYGQGVKHLKKLEQQLSLLGERDIFLKQDLPKNRMLVTTGQDSADLAKDITQLHNRDKYPEDFAQIRSNLLDKYFDSAIEFGEKQIAKIEKNLRSNLGISSQKK